MAQIPTDALQEASGSADGSSLTISTGSGGGNRGAADIARPSLLDQVKDQLAKDGKTGVIAIRVVVVGEIVKNGVDITQYYSKFMKKQQAETQAEEGGGEGQLFTGLLIVTQNYFIHALEGPAKAIYAFLRDMITPNAAPVANAQLLLFEDDISTQHFNFWVCKVVEGEARRGPDLDASSLTADEIPRTIGDIAIKYLNIGVHMASLSKSDFKVALDDLTDKYADAIPNINVLQTICRTNALTSVQEWATFYHGNEPLFLESELIWPAAKALVV